MNRTESTREEWPFQPWPARRGPLFDRRRHDMTQTAAVISRAGARRWLLLVSIPVLVVGVAAVAMARMHAGDIGSSAAVVSELSSSAPVDRGLAVLILEHRRAIHGP